MNGRWSRLALGIGIVLALFAIFWAVRLFMQPNLPRLIQCLTFAVESAVLLYGSFSIRGSQSGKKKHGGPAFLAIFLAVILLGAAAGITLTDQRPHFTTSQKAASVDQPVTSDDWLDFRVRYTDHYYMDLTVKGDEPVTFRILDENNSAVYEVTETDFNKNNIRLKLPAGQYRISMSATSGYEVKCELD